MALIKCEDCGKEISSDAKACPECGSPQNRRKSKQGCLGCLGVIVLAVIISSIMWLVGEDEPQTAKIKDARPPAPTQSSAPEVKPVVFDVISNDSIPGIKLQIDLRTPMADGWLPNLDRLKATVDFVLERAGYSSGKWERAFVTFFVPELKNPIAGYHNEKRGKTEFGYHRTALEYTKVRVLLPPAKACGAGSREAAQKALAGGDPYAMSSAGVKLYDAGCPALAVDLLTKAIDSGKLKPRKERVQALSNLFGDDKKPPPTKIEIVNHPLLAHLYRGMALCQMAVLKKDRSLYAQALKDFKRAEKLSGPDDKWQKMLLEFYFEGIEWAQSLR